MPACEEREGDSLDVRVASQEKAKEALEKIVASGRQLTFGNDIDSVYIGKRFPTSVQRF